MKSTQTIITETLNILGTLSQALGLPAEAIRAMKGAQAGVEAALSDIGDKESITPMSIASTVLSASQVAMTAAGFPNLAAWPHLLAPTVLAWIAEFTKRPLTGAYISGVADLT